MLSNIALLAEIVEAAPPVEAVTEQTQGVALNTAWDYFVIISDTGLIVIAVVTGGYVIVSLFLIIIAILSGIFGYFIDVIIGYQMGPGLNDFKLSFEVGKKVEEARRRGYQLMRGSEATPKGRIARYMISPEGTDADLGVGQVAPPPPEEEFISLVSKTEDVQWPITFENRTEGAKFTANQFFIPLEFIYYLEINALTWCGKVLAPLGSLIGSFLTFAGVDTVNEIMAFFGLTKLGLTYETLNYLKIFCLTSGIEALALKAVFLLLAEANETGNAFKRRTSGKNRASEEGSAQWWDWFTNQLRKLKFTGSTLLLSSYAWYLVSTQYNTKIIELITLPRLNAMVTTEQVDDQGQVAIQKGIQKEIRDNIEQIEINKINITTYSILSPGFIQFATAGSKGTVKAGEGKGKKKGKKK